METPNQATKRVSGASASQPHSRITRHSLAFSRMKACIAAARTPQSPSMYAYTPRCAPATITLANMTTISQHHPHLTLGCGCTFVVVNPIRRGARTFSHRVQVLETSRLYLCTISTRDLTTSRRTTYGPTNVVEIPHLLEHSAIVSTTDVGNTSGPSL